jgi:hypothetical protein
MTCREFLQRAATIYITGIWANIQTRQNFIKTGVVGRLGSLLGLHTCK